MRTLRMTKETMAYILDAARAANGNETMGLLAGRRGSDAVTDARVLQANASGTYAEAEPMTIKRCADELVTSRLIPKGLWHSHGNLGVFHSGIDNRTMKQLLPAMAPWNFERPRPMVPAPTVTDMDSAVLPLPDSQVLRFTLLEPPINGMEGNTRVQWSDISTRFGDVLEKPRAILEDDHLVLEGGSVLLLLGIPEGASITSRKEDHAPLRIATLYSLVVNNHGKTHAECLVVHDIDGYQVLQQEPCTIVII
jgi:proteasome lid subunit RPN8/RPN11